MKVFGVEVRSHEPQTQYTFADEELARMMGINIDGIDSNKAKEATFYTSLKLLTDAVSKLPLKLHKDSDTDNSHYLYNLLKLRPNKHMTSSAFWKTVEYNRNYHGHAVVAIDYHGRGKDAGKVKALIPLDMHQVEVLIDDIGLFKDKDNSLFFIYRDKRGKEFKFKSSEVLHFMGMTYDGITPMPVKDYLRTLIDNSQASNNYVNSYLKNGLHSKGIIKFTGDLSEHGQKTLQERMNRISGGTDKAGQIMPLPVGMDYQNITSSMADSQFIELQELSMRQIAAAFGIKLHQLNESEGGTTSNAEHQRTAFYVDTLQTILTAYEQELTYKLLTGAEVDQGYFFQFNVDAILRSMSKERAEYLAILVEKGIMTPAEARKIIDLPLLEGSDELIVNGSYLRLIDAVNGINYDQVDPSKGGEDND